MAQETEQIQNSTENINQFLEGVVSRAKKSFAELTKSSQSQPTTDSQQLRIQKGRRVVQGQTVRGMRQDLTKEDAKTLNDLISQPQTEGVKASDYERKVPNYEIKVGDEVLFRQERDGVISTNQLQVEKQQKTEQQTEATQESPSSENFSYKDAFSAEWDPEPEEVSQETQSQAPKVQPTLDQDQDGLTDKQEELFGTSPTIPDTDRDGVIDSKEFFSGMNPLSQDSDGDGTTDSADPNPTQLSNDKQTKVAESAFEATVVDDIPPAVRVAEREAQKLPEGSAKELAQALTKKVGEKAKQLGQQGVSWIANTPQRLREQSAASTALKLFNQNYQQTGQTNYDGVSYNIKLKGLNNYEISDKEGNSLMKFQKGRLGVKVQENNLSTVDQKQFDRAGRTLNQFEGVMGGDPQQRLARLQNLAPQGDRDIVRMIQSKEVEQTAHKFLTYMGTEKLNGNGMYSIERKGQDLQIASKQDGRGVVFERKSGKITNNLGSKDFTHFQDLNRALDKSLQKITGLETAQQPKAAQTVAQPKVKKERELSL